MSQEYTLLGYAVAPGIAIGPAFLYYAHPTKPPEPQQAAFSDQHCMGQGHMPQCQRPNTLI